MTITISITSNSNANRVGSESIPESPVVTINGERAKCMRLLQMTTMRVIVFDPMLPPTDPKTFLLNKEVTVRELGLGADDWNGYRSLFDYVQNIIKGSGDPSNLMFLIATSGFDDGMVPPPGFSDFLFSCGAGKPLQKWLSKHPGKTNPPAWVSSPTNYMFMGASGQGYDNAIAEMYETTTEKTLTSTVTVTF